MKNFGKNRVTTPLQDSIELFVDELENELTFVQIYLYEMDNFLQKKLKMIDEEIKNEEPSIKSSILSQPNYNIYNHKFNDLVCKNIFTALISKLEINILELIVKLQKKNVIKKKFKKPKNNIILTAILFLETELKLEKHYVKNIELLIKVRNCIIHNDSKLNSSIKSHPYFPLVENFITNDKKYFYMKDLGLNMFLLKEIRIFFNGLSSQIS